MADMIDCRTLIKAIAGSLGASCSMAALYPLDILRTLLQVADNCPEDPALLILYRIIKTDGIATVYRGLVPNLIAVATSNFVYFYTFHGLKHLWPSHDQNSQRDSLLAYIAGSVNVLLTTPLWVSSVRVKLQKQGYLKKKDDDDKETVYYNGLLDALRKIYRNEGLSALWNGTAFSLLLVLNPSIQFMLYESIKRYLLSFSSSKVLDAHEAFLVGAGAKFISTIITYPLQVLQSRQRAGQFKKISVLQWMEQTLKNLGIRGFFRGIEAKLWQTVITSAFMFLFYEKITHMIYFCSEHFLRCKFE